MNSFKTAKFISIKLFLIILLTSCISKKPLVTTADNGEANHTDVNILLQSIYLPEKKDIPLIVHNSNTGHYYSRNDDCNFKSTKIIVQDYEDSLLTIKKSSKIIITYKNGLDIKREFFESESSVRATDYIRNTDGILLKTIFTISGVEKNRFEYRYDKDRIYEIYIQNNYILYYDTYFLNQKKQCYRKISQLPNHEITGDYHYLYDNRGRNIKISYGTYENIFTYSNDADYMYSSSTQHDLESGKFSSSLESIKEGKKRTLISRDENKNVQLKMIYITEPNCNTKTYSYDRKNKLIGISITTIEE